MSLSLPALSRSVLLLVVAVVLLPCTPARAQMTILVPANYPTIQSAINAANNGDTVLVSPGTYVENINFGGKAITVNSSGGASVTIIDGNHNGTVVTFNHSEAAASVLSGFTIRNGYLSGGSGAGILVSSASPTIISNTITANHAAVAIGIFVNGGSPLIKNNTITGNDQTNAGDGGLGGGGIAVSGTSSSASNPQIINNIITNNSVAAGGDGGGISVTYFSSPVIQGNLIRGNSAYNNGGGISLNAYNSPVVSNNLIVNNNAGGGGSGGGLSVFARSGATVTVVNNTIAANTAYDGTSGIVTTGSAQYATLTNNIVMAAAGQTAVTCNTLWSSASALFSYNGVYSATGTAWTAACDHTSNPGNVSSDPQFLDAPQNDFHLALASPAVDAGNSSAANLPSTDLDGNPRIADGNSDSNSSVDLGAFEVTPTSAANLNPSALSFVSQAFGSISDPQTTTFASTGATSSQITSVQITGDFAQTTNCPQYVDLISPLAVPSGSNCTFNVTFTPTASGPRSGLLTINQTNGTSLTLPLSGVGGSSPTATFSPNNVVFFLQQVGSTSAQQSVTLTNTGSATLNISSISAGGAFSQTNDCGTSLAVGSSCLINVVFSPIVAGSASGSLVVQDQTYGLTSSATLSGTGADFSLITAQPFLSFAAGSSGQVAYTVYSPGGAFQNTVTFSCLGLPAGLTCSFAPSSLVPSSDGVVTTLTVDSQASAQGGSFPVTIQASSGSLSHSVQLFLTIAKPSLLLSSSSLNFGLQPVGSSTTMNLTLTNTNVGPVMLSSISVTSAAFAFAQSNNCGSILPINSSCTVSVTFAPGGSGGPSGILSIQDNVDGRSYAVNLTGTGVDFAVSTTPSAATVIRGNAAAFSVSVSPLGGAYSPSVALSCSGLPAGASCSFSPQSVAPGSAGATANLTIDTDQHDTPPKTYAVTIVGSSVAAAHATQVQLIVNKNKNN